MLPRIQCVARGNKPQHNWVVGAIDIFKMVPTSMPKTYGVLQLSYAVDGYMDESLPSYFPGVGLGHTWNFHTKKLLSMF